MRASITRTAVHEQHDEHNEQGQRRQDRKRGLGALEILELAGPADAVSGRERGFLVDHPAREIHIVRDADLSDIDEHEAHQLPILVAKHVRAGVKLKLGQLRERHLRPARRRHQHPREGLRILAELARIAQA